MKKVISKILQIPHSQWVYYNFSLRDYQTGFLRRKDLKALMVKMETLLDTRPDEIPEDSKFLLEFDHRHLKRFNTYDKPY